MTSPQLDHYKAQLNKHLTQFDQKLTQNPYVQLVTDKAQIRPSYLVLGATSLVLLFLVWGVGAGFVANLVGFCYPLYASYRSLHDGQADETDSEWLTYWVVYAAFNLTESLTDAVMLWIPLYHLVKILFLVWCFAPQTRGALLLYHKLIEPFLMKYETRIDRAGATTRSAVGRVARDVREEVSEEISAKKNDLVNSAVHNLVNNSGNMGSFEEPKKMA